MSGLEPGGITVFGIQAGASSAAFAAAGLGYSVTGSIIKTWEDAPFYARSTLASRLYGEQVVAVQESLNMRRFTSPIVQFMLPYRMPRAPG